MINYGKFNTAVIDMLCEIEETQKNKLAEAGRLIYGSLENGGMLHVFSTGHSHMLVEELFYRAGGLIQIDPILDPALMLHQGAVKSTRLERLSGYAECIFEGIDAKEGEPLLIASNSGINPVPVEMALLAKRKKLKVIAITSLDISGALEPRHASGKKLMDIADVVIGNCLKDGDAVMEIPGMEQKIAAVSSMAGIYIVQRLVIAIVNEFLKDGRKPPVFMSANVPGGDEHNACLLERYGGRIRGLY